MEKYRKQFEKETGLLVKGHYQEYSRWLQRKIDNIEKRKSFKKRDRIDKSMNINLHK